MRLELESHPGASAEARRAIALLEADVSERARADLSSIVTELISNSVKYGPGGEIEVSLAVEGDGHVHGEVRDGGAGKVAIREVESFAEGGLGLRIVDGLSDRWGVKRGTSNVWFELSPLAASG